MLRFDRMKIITSINNIKDINANYFVANIKNDEILYYKYLQEKPFYLNIIADYGKGELSIEFTGKILLDDYISLINKNNIKECFLQINRLGVCILDIDCILNDSLVVKCDITKDIVSDQINEIVLQIRQNISNYKKWIVKEYREGVSIENIAKTSRYKKRLLIYNKSKELLKATNNHFMSSLSDKERLLSYFEDKIRFELSINTMVGIRNLLNIPNNGLYMVLDANTNPILSVIDEAVKYNNAPVKFGHQTLRDYEHELLLKDCNFDLVAVEAKVRALSSKNTSIKRVMQPYRDLYKQIMSASITPNIDIRMLVA